MLFYEFFNELFNEIRFYVIVLLIVNDYKIQDL